MVLPFKIGYDKGKKITKQGKIMLKFIYFSMAVIAFSFFIMPLFNGISAQRDQLNVRPVLFSQNQNIAEDELSFEEIYALANEDQFNPENLNNIAPAAGEALDPIQLPNDFSNQVEPQAHPAL